MPSLRRAALLLALVASQINGSAAFAPSKSAAKLASALASASLKDMPSEPLTGNDSYGEQSRKYRRTVYSHDDWVKHRSPDRFYRNLASLGNSGIYKSLLKEVSATTAVAALLVVWNMIFGEYQDFNFVTHPGIFHDSLIPVLALPLAPFSLSSPSLGLLLVFRTNTSYQRWDEARKNWGMNINHTRDLVRLGSAYYDRSAVSPERAEEDLTRLALCTWAFVRSMKRHLSPPSEDEEDFRKEMLEKLPKRQAEKIFEAAHRPNRALQDLSVAIENLPMHFIRKNEIHRAATIFEDNLGSSERLLSSPVPLFYTRHTARFLSFWLLLLPFGLWEPLGNSWNHFDLIPTHFFLSIFLFGIEELATQLEEPFTILPMQAFCDKIYNWITEIADWVPGDNGMPVYSANMPVMTQGAKVTAAEPAPAESSFQTIVQAADEVAPQAADEVAPENGMKRFIRRRGIAAEPEKL
jgi:putative membrane protein